MPEILGQTPNFVLKSCCSLKKNSSLRISLIFLNFCPKVKVFSKKRSTPKFGDNFLQLVIVAALKFVTFSKFFISLPKKFWYCPDIFLSLPKKFEFCPNFGNWGEQLLPQPPSRYSYGLSLSMCSGPYARRAGDNMTRLRRSSVGKIPAETNK